MAQSTARDPRDTLANAPMTMPQVLAVGATIALNALDGFDVLAISFASPGIAAEWRIDRAALGIVLSMELVGMAIGSVVLGSLADRVGRRPTVLGCLVIMAFGMFMATTASGIVSLSAWRLVTGLGIGGVLATINAAAAEFSNARRRHLAVSLMAIGYPLGAVLGGLVAQQLLAAYSWRAVFYFGTLATVACIPIVLVLVPESVVWLARRQPAGALHRINRTLTRWGHEPIANLPPLETGTRHASVAELFSTGLRRTTVLATLAYFCHITTFYFIVKWIPKIVVDMGFQASAAAGVLVWANVGGATGGALFGVLTGRVALKTLLLVTLGSSVVMVSVFGRSPADLGTLSAVSAAAGFFTNAGIVGLYAMFAQAFPTYVRATGTGFVIGLGRGGAVLAPIIAGLLFTAGISLPVVAIVMACGSMFALAAIALLPFERRQ
jgi:benzoate transport